MAQIRISIVEQFGGTSTTVEVPDDVPVNQFLPALITSLDLPASSNSISYRLKSLSTGERLIDDATMKENGITNGDSLRLEPVHKNELTNVINFFVRSPDKGDLQNIQAPTTTSIQDVQEIIIEKLGLPRKDKSGREIFYRLVVQEDKTSRYASIKGNIDQIKDGSIVSIISTDSQENSENTLALMTSTLLNSENYFSQPQITQKNIQRLRVAGLDTSEKTQHNAISGSIEPPGDNVFGILNSVALSINSLEPKLDAIMNWQLKIDNQLIMLQRQQDEYSDVFDKLTKLQENTIVSSSISQPAANEPEYYQPPEISFVDFDLIFSLISQDEGRYHVQATWLRDASRIDGKQTFLMPVSRSELEYEYLLRMGIVSRGSSGSGVPTRDELAREFGKKLFDAVFNGTVRDCFTQCQSYIRAQSDMHGQRFGVRIRLHLNDVPELMNYPWEFLWNDEDDFLACNLSTPIVRYHRSTTPPRRLKLPEQEPMRMLVLTANPQGSISLNIEAEQLGLTKALKGIIDQGLLKIEWLEHATSAKLRKMLNVKGGPHILHYIGHGDVDDKIGGYLCMEGEDAPQEFLSGRTLGMWLRSCYNLQLVVLNACRGARTKADDPFSNIASEIVRAQVPAVVAMQYEISDRAAIKFSRAFYRCMANGWSIYEAMGDTRQELGNDIERMIPVLYSRSPDGILFKRSILSNDNVS